MLLYHYLTTSHIQYQSRLCSVTLIGTVIFRTVRHRCRSSVNFGKRHFCPKNTYFDGKCMYEKT